MIQKIRGMPHSLESPASPTTRIRRRVASQHQNLWQKLNKGTEIGELTENLQGVTMRQVQEEKVGKERKKRVAFEAGTGEVKRKKSQLPPGWEWVWMEDLWTGCWERLRVPKKEVDYRRRRNIPPQTL